MRQIMAPAFGKPSGQTILGWPEFCVEREEGVCTMKIPITPHLLDLVADAALKSFWRKGRLPDSCVGAGLRRKDRTY
jgi:hypothetical protein